MAKLLLDENNVIHAWQKVGGGWSDTEYTTVEVDEIPEEVQMNSKNYCYIEGMFVENPAIDRLTPLIESKVQDFSNICTQTIYNGTDVTLSDGTVQHFTLTEQDQLNLSGLGLKLTMGATQIAWHEDNEDSMCRYYSAEDAQTIIGTLTTFKEYHITYFRDLRLYIRGLTTEEEVNNVNYGFALPEEAKSDVLKDFEQMLGGE